MQPGRSVILKLNQFWFVGREDDEGRTQLDTENFANLSEAMKWADRNQPGAIFKLGAGMDLQLWQIDRLLDVYHNRKLADRVGVKAMMDEGLIRYQGKWKKRKRVLTDRGKALAEEIISAG